MPKISVIIPVYKVEKYLRRCLDSILSQTFTDFELLLIDDGSPDNCGVICDEYAQCDKRVKVFHTDNRGVSAARNTGIEWVLENSNSKWISFIDSDDWVHSRYLEVLLEAAIKNNTSISSCGYVRTNVQDLTDLDEEISVELWKTDEYFIKRNVNAIVPWAKLYKKELFENVRYPLNKRYEDEATTYKVLFLFENIAVVEAEMYYYYTNSESFMAERWTPRRMDLLLALEERLEYFKNYGYEHLYKFDSHSLIISICKYIIALKKDVTNEYKCKYESILVKQLRKRLKIHNKICKDIPIKRNEWIYELAYPKQMKIYWIIKSLKDKFIKK